MQVRWSRTALQRMVVLPDFIAARESAAAVRVIDDLFDRVGILAEQPGLGRAFPGSPDASIRQMNFDKYRVTYHVDDARQAVTVLTVQHTREEAVRLDELAGEE